MLLAGALLAATTCICLRLAGNEQGVSLLPLILPCVLWWPVPSRLDQRLYWWLSVVCIFGFILGLLLTTLPLLQC